LSKAAAKRTNTAEQRLLLERRKSQRAELVVRVDYQTVDELFSDFARNINEGGIFVETETPPERGTSVDLQFRLPGEEEPVRVRGTVVRVSRGEGGDPPGMGIEFGDLDAATRERINGLVRSLRAAPRHGGA
jgi:type IV pilus assembly protein PilZ